MQHRGNVSDELSASQTLVRDAGVMAGRKKEKAGSPADRPLHVASSFLQTIEPL